MGLVISTIVHIRYDPGKASKIQPYIDALSSEFTIVPSEMRPDELQPAAEIETPETPAAIQMVFNFAWPVAGQKIIDIFVEQIWKVLTIKEEVDQKTNTFLFGPHVDVVFMAGGIQFSFEVGWFKLENRDEFRIIIDRMFLFVHHILDRSALGVRRFANPGEYVKYRQMVLSNKKELHSLIEKISLYFHPSFRHHWVILMIYYQAQR